MLPGIREFIDNLTKPRPSFSLQDLENFPYDEFNRNLSRYGELERWFDGTALDETVERQGKEIEIYPVKFNPLPRTIEQHAHYLFGQVQQDDRPLVYPKVNPLDFSEEQQVEAAKDLENILHRVWAENQGRAIQWQAGAQSQLYGGCVFRIVYAPRDPLRTIPFRIEVIHPNAFVGVPDGADIWRIREAWIVRVINTQEAAEHEVYLPERESAWMIEHYTNSQVEVTINGQPASREGNPLSGRNHWGFVPIVYIPHIRVFGFYGDTFVENVQGLIREMNLRLADYGDAVTTDAHRYTYMVNVHGTPSLVQTAPGLFTLNLGNVPYITGNEKEPRMGEVGTSRASEPMDKLVDKLYANYRRLVSIPSVAEGEDEGSQRSAATLVTRMISLVSHTESERVFWSTGLNLLTRMLIKMLMMTPRDTLGENVTIRPEYLIYPVRHEWAPILPRDREVLVQEAIQLMAAKLGSIERLLDLLGVDNSSEEREKILKDLKEFAELTAAAQPQERGAQGSSVSAQEGTPARESINQE